MSAADLREQLQITLGSGFRVATELGGGGMSRVFRVADEALGRDVIVKVLSSELAEGVSLERFSREIRTLAQLQHPHIVPVLSAGRIADGLPYYVMPYVAGESARSLVVGGRRPPVEQVIHILRDVARALDFAHSHGVVHRDIKPDNILLSGDSATVSDFGIAKAVTAARTPSAEGTLTQVGTAIGTPMYMAPEQALGGDVDARADIYALGVTAYELLAGTPPFKGSAPELIRAHITEPPPALHRARADIPAWLADLVMRCLEKDPARRPASARDVLRALEGSHERGPGPRAWAAIAVAVLALTLALMKWADRGASAGGDGRAPAVAVLPFANLSGDTASEYFSDGMTEQLVGALSRAEGLRVASRSATFAQKGKTLEPRAAASALHVDYLVSGSVRRVGNQLRITAELVDGRSGEPRWSDVFDRGLDDAFAVQEDIGRSITSALKVSLAPSRPPADGVTYDFFLRGQHVRRGVPGTPVSQRRAVLDSAIRLLEQSTARDSTFAPAWAELAEAYRLKAEYVSPLQVLPRAKEAAQRATQLDPSDPGAGLALANILLNYDWNWNAAEREYRRVLAMHPDHAATGIAYTQLLTASRRVDEGFAVLERAHAAQWRKATDTTGLRADQLVRMGIHLGWTERREAFESVMQQARALNPSPGMRWTYGRLLATWEPKAGLDSMLRSGYRFMNDLPHLSHLGVAYGNAGYPDSTRRIIAEVLRRSRNAYVPKDQLFTLYLSLGERREALRWLRQAVDERHYWLPYLNASPPVKQLRDDPELRALMRRIGVPESAL